MVALLLMMLAIQFGENWLAFAVVGVTILTMRSVKATILLSITLAVLYIMRGSLEPYWPVIFFGLVIVALIFGAKSGGGGQEQPEYYSPDMYGGLMGGG